MRPAPAEGEAVLVDRAKAGDRDAFEELVRRHAERLYAVVLRFVADGEEAQEVTQEAFLRAWRGIARFEGRSRFFTWLYRIGINEAKRRASRQPPVPVASLEDEPVPEAPDWSEAPETRSEQGDLRRVLEQAIRSLPVEYRAPIVLRDDLNHAERERVEEHVVLCPQCRRVLATLRRTLAGLRELGAPRRPDLADGIIERLRDQG
jgi:RNA polymerase sigma-70 factor (ECF subfamily)